jgi:hypothetical protein
MGRMWNDTTVRRILTANIFFDDEYRLICSTDGVLSNPQPEKPGVILLCASSLCLYLCVCASVLLMVGLAAVPWRGSFERGIRKFKCRSSKFVGGERKRRGRSWQEAGAE